MTFFFVYCLLALALIFTVWSVNVYTAVMTRSALKRFPPIRHLEGLINKTNTESLFTQTAQVTFLTFHHAQMRNILILEQIHKNTTKGPIFRQYILMVLFRFSVGVTAVTLRRPLSPYRQQAVA